MSWALASSGMAPGRLQMELSTEEGYVAQIELRRVALPLCFLIVGPVPPRENVVVEVRDVATGRAPKADVTLEVIGDSTVFLDSAVAVDSSKVVLDAANQLGVFDVLVRAEGYSDWAMKNVYVTVNSCGDLERAVLTAWLLPSGQPVEVRESSRRDGD